MYLMDKAAIVNMETSLGESGLTFELKIQLKVVDLCTNIHEPKCENLLCKIENFFIT